MNQTAISPEPTPALRPATPDSLTAVRGAKIRRFMEAAMLVCAGVFFALHFVHLKADFPNHSLWADWSKYTDEGWYGDAAIRHYQLGHWNLPGDFNPAAALPVWPVLEMVVFRFTGVSVIAARALTVTVFGLSLVCCYLLMRRWPIESGGRSLAPALTALLLAVNPMCFAFSRLALLEPLLILLTLAALLVASAAGQASARAWSSGHLRLWDLQSVAWAVGLGLLLPLIVLTKTTGVFLFPAIFWMLWASSEYRLRPFLRTALMAGGVGAAAWSAYYGLFVRPHYLVDYRYLFASNTYTGITLDGVWPEVESMILDLQWIGETLFVLVVIAVLGWLLRLRRERRNPLPQTLLVWVFGYAAFLTYHANLSPRYYVALAFPLTMLTAMFFEPIVARTLRPLSSGSGGGGATAATHVDESLRRLPARAAGVAIVFVIVHGGMQTVSLVRHPQYTFARAAEQIRQAVAQEAAANPSHSSLLLSISGAQLSLMTGLESICDDFGSMDLSQRVATYRPGWFAAWNQVDDDKMEVLARRYRLVRVGAYPALDDPLRNLLILYRLDPAESSQMADEAAEPYRPRGAHGPGIKPRK
jgi:4-amino-4-deoxy-L-arabinose transferase-like glycosyltransferase